MARFLFLVGLLETTDIFSREMEEYLKGEGHKCLEMDVSLPQKELKRIIKEHNKEPFLGAIAFNNIGFSLGEEGENFWENLGILYIDILMDHPFCFSSKLSQLSKNTRLYCVDRNHVSFLKKYFSNIENVDFLPHGGCLFESQKAPDVTDRDIDILYPGNLSRVLVENLIPDFDAFSDFDGAEFSKDVLGYLINNPDSLTEDIICLMLKDMGLYYSPSDELQIISAFRFVDGFAVSYFRELSVRILVENGFKVGVLGAGWESCPWAENENLNIIDKVSPEKVLSYMKRSKVVLNTMTWFKAGGHDRIFNGNLCGCGVLSDSSDFTKEIFKEEESISYFDLKEMERLPYIADRILSEDDYRESLIDKARSITCSNHTWNNRTEKILKDLGLL